MYMNVITTRVHRIGQVLATVPCPGHCLLATGCGEPWCLAWSAIGEIKKLGCAVARHTGDEESTTIRHLFQQLSIALAKGNAALFNNRNPSDSSEGGEGFGW